MTIQQTKQNDTIVFTLKGRLDTATSPQLHDTLIPAIDGTCNIMLDFAELLYVSSAGLRVLLTAQKKCTANGVSMKLQGVREEIMEVFDMTGFSDILDINN